MNWYLSIGIWGISYDKEIRVGVPKETTMEQWQVLQRSAERAEKDGVKITFGVEK